MDSYCNNCGKKVLDDDSFCNSCGQDLQVNKVYQHTPGVHGGIFKKNILSFNLSNKSMKFFIAIFVTAVASSTLTYAALHYFPQTKVDVEDSKTQFLSTTTKQVGAMIPELYPKKEVYKYIFGYSYLLDKKSFAKLQTLNDLIKKRELFDYISLLYVEGMFYELPDVADELMNLISEVEAKKIEGNFFEKSTTCSTLVSDIKKDLALKPTKSYGKTLTEEFEFIFYSPNLDTCIYVTNYSSYDPNTFNTDNYKKIYNANTQTLVNTYTVSLSGSWEDADKKAQNYSGQQDFVRYVLENANYNFELLDNSEYIEVIVGE